MFKSKKSAVKIKISRYLETITRAFMLFLNIFKALMKREYKVTFSVENKWSLSYHGRVLTSYIIECKK